jgi:pimeloyl-ACP methyl ester carboxylesterase
MRFVDEGRGPVLLLLHGLGGNWQNWQANIAGLAQRHRVVAPDLPGFGGSDSYRGAVSMSRYADTVVEFLDALGIGSAFFVGNSMGGLLSIEAAARHPERVKALLLACSGGIPLTTVRHRFVLRPGVLGLNAILRRAPIRRAALSNSVVRQAIAARIMHRPQRIRAGHLAAALDGLGAPGLGTVLRAGLRYDARLHAPRLRCPTLIVWGRHDRLLPVWMGEQLHHHIADSDFVVWDDTGHCPMIEQPHRFNELLETFARRCCTNSGRSDSEGPPSGG